MFLWKYYFFRILLFTFFFHLPLSLANPLVISKYGASEDYPGCMDFSTYESYFNHVDILDYLVRLAKDGTQFALLKFFLSIPVQYN